MEDIDDIIERLLNNECPTVADISLLCNKALPILKAEPNVAKTQSPITVLGDVHGDFDDVLQIFSIFGMPNECKYCFIGDFVDRGEKSVHTISLLLAFKVKYPDRVFLIRGNHEGYNMTSTYGFYDEIMKRFGDFLIWRAFIEVFCALPVGVLIDNNIFGIHGGLTPYLDTIEKLDSLNRNLPDTTQAGIRQEPILKDLMWNDPADGPGIQPALRDGGKCWGPDVTEKFIERNKLKFVVRGHETVNGGYKWNHNQRVLTVFSSPSYTGGFHEGAALEVLSPTKIQLTRFRPKAWENQLFETTFKNFSIF